MLTFLQERKLQIIQILAGSGLVIIGIADVTGGTFLWGFLWYLPVGIPIALLMVVGLSLGRRGGLAITLGSMLVAAMAFLGALSPWPIPLPGESLWWWPLFAVAIASVVMTLRLDLPGHVEEPRPPAPTILAPPPVPRFRWPVLAAQVLIALAGIRLIFSVVDNAQEMEGIVVPALVIPVAVVLIAGLAYLFGVRWPVVVTNAPLAIYALVVGAGIIVHASENEDPAGVAVLAVVGVSTAFSMLAALLPPRPAPLVEG